MILVPTIESVFYPYLHLHSSVTIDMPNLENIPETVPYPPPSTRVSSYRHILNFPPTPPTNCKPGCEPPNRVRTSRFTWFSFLPLFFLQQFSSTANWFFIFVAVLQSIPAISDSGGVPLILVPLSIVWLITAIRDVWEDLKRRKADRTENKRVTSKIDWTGKGRQNTGCVTVAWDKLVCGDMIKLSPGESLPADCILLWSSSQAFVKTASIDGETDLKPKESVFETVESLPEKFQVSAEESSGDLRVFRGCLDDSKNLSMKNLLLRGSSVHAAAGACILAVVVYAGHQCRLMMNTAIAPRKKRSQLSRAFEFHVPVLFTGILTLCFAMAYIGNRQEMITWFFAWFVHLAPVVPLSLLTTLEVIQTIQGQLLKRKNTVTAVHAYGVLEELGLVTHVMTDKTGTLTENCMRLIEAVAVKSGKGVVTARIGADDTVNVTNSGEPLNILGVLSYAMSICHSRDAGGCDADETALIAGAELLGSKYIGRANSRSIQVMVDGSAKSLELLALLEFDSDRKMMSVIVRGAGKVTLWLKGADSSVLARCMQVDQSVQRELSALAKRGLRTLAFGKREWKDCRGREGGACTSSDPSCACKLKDWLERFNILSAENRAQEIFDEVETRLELVGWTGVEDRLQPGVKDTIQSIRSGGSNMHARKVWMLTGDKTETAIAIASTAGLIDDSGDAILIEKESDLVHLSSSSTIVVTGDTLERLQSTFIPLAVKCETVIACRVTPKQKAELVKALQRSRASLKSAPVSVLAIGDGGNDVGMIVSANVGVGLVGKEGSHAAKASDMEISTFSNLHMLLQSGNYLTANNAWFIYFMVGKNAGIPVTLLLYHSLTGFGVEPIFPRLLKQLFNLVFALLPAVLLTLAERRGSGRAQEIQKKTSGTPPRVIGVWRLFIALLCGSWAAFCCVIPPVLVMPLLAPSEEPLPASTVGEYSFFVYVFIVNIGLYLVTRRYLSYGITHMVYFSGSVVLAACYVIVPDFKDTLILMTTTLHGSMCTLMTIGMFFLPVVGIFATARLINYKRMRSTQY